MQSAFIATCPNSNEAVIVVLGVTTVSEFRAAAAAQGLIRTCDDEEGYEFYKPLQAWAVLTPEGTWDLGASSDAPDALPAMVATARWVSITSCQCEACPVKDGTHKPAEAVHQIAEPAASVEKQIEEVMRKVEFLRGAAQFGSPCELDAARKGVEEKLRTLLSAPQPCSRSHPHEEMTPMCELRTEIARLTNALARAEAQLAAAPQAVQPIDLPDYFEIFERQEAGKPINALEQFILDNEPAAGDEEQQFREGLKALLAWVANPTHRGMDAQPSIGTLWVEENGANDLELCPFSAPKLQPGEYALFAQAKKGEKP